MSLDRVIREPLPDLPAAAGAGSFIITDPRGESTKAVVGLSATSVWLVDMMNGDRQKLPNPPAGFTWGAGMSAIWDPSRGTNAHGRVYVFGPGLGAGADAFWAHLDMDTLAWNVGGAPEIATLNAILAGTWGTDAALAHTCSAVAAAGDDNSIYLVGNNGLPSFRYDISEPAGVGWTSVPPADRLVIGGAGVTLNWCWGWSPNRLVSLDAGGLATAEYYRILADAAGGANAWAAMAPVPAFTTDVPNVGTCSCTSCDGSKVYFKLNKTGHIFSFTPVDLRVRGVAEIQQPDGVADATVGRRMAAFKYRGREYLVVLVQGLTYVWRIRLS